jgi:uncharacterized membrane protein YhiD involved in acid resistance
MAAGAAAWGVALAATVIVVVSLWPLHLVEERLVAGGQYRLHVRLDASSTEALARMLETNAARPAQVRQLGSERTADGRHRVDLELRGRNAESVARILRELDAIEGIAIEATEPLVD